MFTLAALTLSVGAHAVGVRFTFRPEPAISIPVQTHNAQRAASDTRGQTTRDYFIRLAVRMLAGHAPTSDAPGAALREADAQLKIPLYPLLLQKATSSTKKQDARDARQNPQLRFEP